MAICMKDFLLKNGKLKSYILLNGYFLVKNIAAWRAAL